MHEGLQKVSRMRERVGDELCLRLGENDDGCYAVTLKGQSVELVPSGLGLPLDGILEPADQN